MPPGNEFPMCHLFERISMLEMVCLTLALLLVFGGLALVGAFTGSGH